MPHRLPGRQRALRRVAAQGCFELSPVLLRAAQRVVAHRQAHAADRAQHAQAARGISRGGIALRRVWRGSHVSGPPAGGRSRVGSIARGGAPRDGRRTRGRHHCVGARKPCARADARPAAPGRGCRATARACGSVGRARLHLPRRGAAGGRQVEEYATKRALAAWSGGRDDRERPQGSAGGAGGGGRGALQDGLRQPRARAPWRAAGSGVPRWHRHRLHRTPPTQVSAGACVASKPHP
mmetsp:Transcript_19886/g.61680  ORF Transcript_19886/g.61680 Transcript_19886/m.61680 type:complete len:238 (+) Transcript_19886:366-1079(+)